MAKILFPAEGQKLVCKRCGSDIPLIMEFSEDGQLDDYWCDPCTAFVDVRIAPL